MAIYYIVLYNAIICIYPTSPYWKRSILSVHWKDWCWSWNSNTLATWCEELTHLKRPSCWEGLKAGGEGDNRAWDGWMASLTQWTWVWVNSRSWWWTWKPGMQRVVHDWTTELTDWSIYLSWYLFCLTISIFCQFSCSVMSDCLQIHGLQHTRLPCPSPTPGAYSNSSPLSRWCHPTISSSVVPFSSHLQSFPPSGSFPMSQFFTSRGQSIGVSASASVLPMNIQDWFPLGWTGWISLQSKGHSSIFSNTTIQKHQFFSTHLSL